MNKKEVNKQIWESDLRLNDKMMMLSLCRLAQPKGVFAKDPTVAKKMGCSSKTVQRSRKSLLELGVITATPGKHQIYTYTFNVDNLSRLEYPNVDNLSAQSGQPVRPMWTTCPDSPINYYFNKENKEELRVKLKDSTLVLDDINDNKVEIPTFYVIQELSKLDITAEEVRVGGHLFKVETLTTTLNNTDTLADDLKGTDANERLSI